MICFSFYQNSLWQNFNANNEVLYGLSKPLKKQSQIEILHFNLVNNLID